MASLTPTKIILSEINSGIEYIDGDSVQASTINKVVEGTAFAQQKVEELEDSLVLEKGTTVSVNSVPQNTLAFTSDPQTQLNDRIKLTTDQNIAGNKTFIDTVYAEKIRGRNLFYKLETSLGAGGSGSLIGGWIRRYADTTTATQFTVSFVSPVTRSVGLCIQTRSGDSLAGAALVYNRYMKSLSINAGVKLTCTFNFTSADIAAMQANPAYLYVYSETTTDFTTTNIDYQLELGATATTYTPYIGEFATQKFVEDANPFKRSFSSGTSGSITLTEAGTYEFYGTDVQRMSFGIIHWNGSSLTNGSIVFQSSLYSGCINIAANGVVKYYKLQFSSGTTGYTLSTPTITLYFRKLN